MTDRLSALVKRWTAEAAQAATSSDTQELHAGIATATCAEQLLDILIALKAQPVRPASSSDPAPPTSQARIPPAIRAGLDRYAQGGIRPGSFVYAVLANDLSRAFLAADPEARDALPAIVEYVRGMPVAAWGSSEIVERWIARPRS